MKDENEAKGYARGENDYIIFTDDDLDDVALDTKWTIDIEKFAPADSIEWIYLEKPHYLMPDVGVEALQFLPSSAILRSTFLASAASPTFLPATDSMATTARSRAT